MTELSVGNIWCSTQVATQHIFSLFWVHVLWEKLWEFDAVMQWYFHYPEKWCFHDIPALKMYCTWFSEIKKKKSKSIAILWSYCWLNMKLFHSSKIVHEKKVTLSIVKQFTKLSQRLLSNQTAFQWMMWQILLVILNLMQNLPWVIFHPDTKFTIAWILIWFDLA